MESLLGQTLHGKYRIDELIGRGGMGSVYKAEHLGTGRPVAVKTILPRLVTDSSSIERFRREARAAGRLRHPNIVDVTDFGVAPVGDQEVAYLVMEYLEGSTLRALLERSATLSLEVVVDLVEQIALALDAAHALGIVHRDLKPDNIWLIPDPRGGYVVRILDFGIAKLREPGDVVVADTGSALTRPDVGERAVAVRPARALGSDVTVPLAQTDAETAIRVSADEATVSRGASDAPLRDGESSDAPTEVRARSDAPTAIQPSARTSSDAGDPADEPTTLRSGTGPSHGAQLTGMGTTLGTPAYMSPEQCRSEHVDARSDVYSLGIVAWQALAGRRPFEGSYLDLLQKQLEEMPPRVDEVNARVPRRVGEAIAVAMAKSPDGRYSSAGAMAGSIRVASEGPTVILRRSMALYLERFDAFLRISIRCATPAMAVLALEVVGLVVFVLLLQAGVGKQDEFRYKLILGVAVQVVSVMSAVLWSLVTLMNHAVFASVVGILRRRPIDEIDIDEVFADVKQRIGLNSDASLVRTTARMVGYYVKAELKAPAGQGDLAFQIAFHEGRSADEIRERCVTLARTTKRSYDWIRGFILASMLVPPVVEAAVVFSIGSLFHLQVTLAAAVAALVSIMLVPLNAMLINPGLSPSLAVLYFRARQALGESVGLSAVVPSRL